MFGFSFSQTITNKILIHHQQAPGNVSCVRVVSNCKEEQMKVKLSPKKWKQIPLSTSFFANIWTNAPKYFCICLFFVNTKPQNIICLPNFEQMPQMSLHFPPIFEHMPYIFFNIYTFYSLFLPTFEQMLHIIDSFSITRTNALKYFYIRCRCCLIYLPIVSQTLGSCLWPPLQSLFIANIGNNNNILVLYIS